ncbi:SGNH/GDSL hydrolase family protein [Dysgonomonas macrotermitis]|uniref:Uncharacterized protein n=1 Tax=Dysgonomonas macrotermitis TaxID=1346286 RepID=A0A1M4UIV9_9BACT|nr:SGNH/GDSL hydrolase family protein [Dysgonomonas macrotermitis]SHE56500.1 hypothetical protein SAMN05444362_101613 [Dysgonomonas macrotermitis]
MNILDQILQYANQIKNQTGKFLNTSQIVGSVLVGITEYIKNIVSGQIRQPAVDTYALLLSTYPTPANGWTVLVRADKTIYQWNGSQWVNLESAVYPENVATQDDLDDYAKTTTTDGTLVRTADGTIPNVDLSAKADKVSTLAQPVTYYKAASGDTTGETDLTTEFKASFVPTTVAYMGIHRWFFNGLNSNPPSNGNAPVASGDGSANIAGYMAIYKLEPNTTYEIDGNANYIPNFGEPPYYNIDANSNLVAWNNGSPVKREMPSWVLVAANSSGAMQYATTPAYYCYPDYKKKYRFTTPNQELYLCGYVAISSAPTFVVAAASMPMPSMVFDSRETISLKKVSGATGTADALVDVNGVSLKSLDFGTDIKAEITKIEGIVSHPSGGDPNPNLFEGIPTPLTVLDRNIDVNGVVVPAGNTAGASYCYIDYYFPVKPGLYKLNLSPYRRNSWTVSGTTYSCVEFSLCGENQVFIPWPANMPEQPLNRPGIAAAGVNPRTYAYINVPYGLGVKYIRINAVKNTYDTVAASEEGLILQKVYSEDAVETDNLKVEIAANQLSDAQAYGTDGKIQIPTLMVPESNIIKDGSSGGDDTYKISMRNTNTFVGSLNTAIDQIFALKSHARHVLCGHFTTDGSAGNGALKALVATQKAVAQNRNIPFIDLASIMGYTLNDTNIVNGIDYNNLKSWCDDGLHPGLSSSSAMADALFSAVYELLKPIFGNSWMGKNVTVIGDSIAAGYSYNGTTVSWAQFISRALTALGANVTLYASSGGVLRATDTDNVTLSNSFMGNNVSNWGFQAQILDRIVAGTDIADLYLWEIGHNDFMADIRDFKINWN